jgi:hypothetical protein
VSGASGRMRIDAEGDGDVVHLAVGEQAAGVDFPGVEHLAAQRQDRLQFLVAPGFRRATGGVALDQEDLVATGVLALAVRELAGQDGDPRLLASSRPSDRHAYGPARHLMARSVIFLAVVRVFVEPQLERVAQHARDQRDRIARVQALLGLALKRGIEHAHRENEAGTREDVVGGELDALRQQRVVIGETLDRVERRLPQTGLVRAAGRCRNQVDVGFARQAAVGCPADRPGSARAGREVLVALAARTSRH